MGKEGYEREMRETEMQMMESDGDEEKKRWVLGDGRPLRWEVDGVRETSERAWDLPGGRWERFCVSPLDGNGERGFKGVCVRVRDWDQGLCAWVRGMRPGSFFKSRGIRLGSLKLRG